MSRTSEALATAGIVLSLALGWMSSAGLLGAQEIPSPDLSAAAPRVRAAVEAARDKVEASPRDGAAWGRYGMVLEAHRLLDEAATAYRRAQKLDGKTFEWPYFLAVLLEYQDPVEARRWHQDAIRLDPGYAPARIHFGETLEKLGELELAEQQFEKAVMLAPDDPLGHFGLGRLALAAGRLDAAVDRLERAYRLAPEIQAIVATLARAYQRTGRVNEARRLAVTARNLPQMTHRNDSRRARINDLAVHVGAYLQRSKTYREVGDYRRALRELEQALDIDPTLAEAHFAAAGIYDRMGDGQNAVNSARRALELNPDLAGARPVLAGALLKLGRFDEAAEQVDRALLQDPANFHVLVVGSLLAAQKGDVVTLLQRLDRAYAARSEDRELRRVLRQLLVDLSDSLVAIGERRDAAVRMEQVLQLAVEESAPQTEIDGYRRKLDSLRR